MTRNTSAAGASPWAPGLSAAVSDDADATQTSAEQGGSNRLPDTSGAEFSTKAIGELVSLQTDKVFENKNPELPYIGLEHIASGQPKLIGAARAHASTSVNSVFRTDDILFAKLRPNLRKSVRSPFDGYCSTDILVLRCLPGLLPEYAGHLFQTDTVFRAAAASAAGTRMPRSSWADLKRTRVFVPETEAEQRRIAGVLNVIEQAIEERESTIRKLKQLRAGLLHDLLTRGIDENGELRDPFARPSEFLRTPLGTIPRSWNFTRIGQVLLEPPRNGYSPPESPKWTGRFMLGLGCLSLEGFRPIQLKLAPSDAALEPFLLQDGDLLVSRSNTQDLVALPGLYRDIGAPCFYPDLMMRLRPNSKICAEFLELLLRHSRSRGILVASANGTSGSMVKITGAGLMTVPVAFPSANECDEQQRILHVKAALDEEVDSVRQERDKLAKLREGLTHDLLTGRVRVPECALEDSR